ncbi:hypothetical protein RB195_003466 [Necator americanus]|uniref:G-protein coupled receptors family 1 profile domain-containing protein n=1 Tax=Necator americanus TaxID=51031 RepID=A0ABR1DQ75_NECAM
MLATPHLRKRRDFQASEIHRVPRWTCTMKPHVLLLVVAYQLQGVLPLAVAIDRILAIMIPTKYMRFNFRYTIIVAAGPYVFVAIATIIEILISRQDGTKVSSFCLTVTAVSPGFHDYTLLLRIVCVSISALIYLVLISRLNKHIEKAQINGVQIGSLRRSTITVGLSTVNAVIFLLIPDIIKYLAIYNDSLTHIIILYSLSMTNVDLNALIFGFRHREIATSMRRFFCTIVITSTATKKRIIPRRVAAT